MDKFQALHSFWSSFGVPAYDENTVPDADDKPSYPYITYDAVIGNIENKCGMSGSIWDYGTSWSRATTKLNEIQSALGMGGKFFQIDGGGVWIKRGSPFAQRVSDSNDMVRRIFINIEAEFITAE